MGRFLSFMVVVGYSTPPVYACPYDAATAEAHPLSASVDPAAASHAARGADLLGSGCAYATGAMARRVVEQGDAWAYTGELRASSDAPGTSASDVATPFTTAMGRGDPHLLANELLEMLASSGHASSMLSLSGKSLEVDGVVYVVLTSYQVLNS